MVMAVTMHLVVVVVFFMFHWIRIPSMLESLHAP
jgi:hypothetical protein